MKTNKKDIIPGFHAVEFMYEQRKRLTEKYQSDREGFLKDLRNAKEYFLKLREERQHKKGD